METNPTLADHLYNRVCELEAWKESAMLRMREQDAARERILKALPGKYWGWNVWEAAADYIELHED